MMVFKKEIFDYIEKIWEEKGKKKAVKVLYTVEEAAGILNIKVSKIRMAVFRKEISYVKMGALVRFREEDLHEYIEKNLKRSS